MPFKRPNTYKHMDTLEHLLNQGSLGTRRLGHRHIIEVGGGVLTDTELDWAVDRKRAIEEAERRTTLRLGQEHAEHTERLTRMLNEEKDKAVKTTLEECDRKAERVRLARDRQEQEALAELSRKLGEEKKVALEAQREADRRQKETELKEAKQKLSAQLRVEFDIERKQAEEKAVRAARVLFDEELQQSNRQTRLECEEEARSIAMATKRKQDALVYDLRERVSSLSARYSSENHHRVRVESEFRELQTDYQRFMNYTDGLYNSDFMMKLRKHGQYYANRRPRDLPNVSLLPLRPQSSR